MAVLGIRLIGLVLITVFGFLSIVGSGESFSTIVDLDDTVDLSGTVEAEDGSPLEHFFVEAFLAINLDTPEDSTTTDTSGSYTLTVSDSESVTRRYSRVDYATISTRFESYSTDSPGLDIEALTSADAELIIDTAFGGMELDLADKAWLAVEVLDSGGNEVDGALVSTNPDADGGGATFCDGTLTGSNTTVALPVCNPSRDGSMYLAYFDENQELVEIDVSGVSGTITAPLRIGQITDISAQQ